MELKKYELTFIVDAQLEQQKIDELVEHVEKLISGNNGKVIKVDHWGKRRLAYEIERKQYGHYIYFLFESDGSNIKSIEHDLNFNESVLRFLTVKLSKQALKSLRDLESTEEAESLEPEPVSKDVVEKSEDTEQESSE